jgi:hypothetical protein
MTFFIIIVTNKVEKYNSSSLAADFDKEYEKNNKTAINGQNGK